MYPEFGFPFISLQRTSEFGQSALAFPVRRASGSSGLRPDRFVSASRPFVRGQQTGTIRVAAKVC
jgi:hypothetical protein